MKITSLYVRNVRNLSPQEISLGGSFNEFIGDNAQGKTAFLEAIHALIVGKSFRTHQFQDIVSHGSQSCLIEAQIESSGVHSCLRLEYKDRLREVRINEERQETISKLLGNLLGVTCSLKDLDLVYGSPSSRRAYLDQQIAQIDPFYVEQLRRYHRALIQRNCLLKQKNISAIEPFENILAQAAAYIVERRRATALALSERTKNFYKYLFDHPIDTLCNLVYTPSTGGEEVYSFLLHTYARNRERELRLGSTLCGPHRDDLLIYLGDFLAKDVGSCGQIRALCLALRLSEWLLMKERTGEEPLFLIDDIQSLFDTSRIEKILHLCADFGQVYTSSCSSVCSDKSVQFFVSAGVASRS